MRFSSRFPAVAVRFRRSVGVVASVAALVWAPIAVAGPGWTTPTPLGQGTQLSLAVDHDGKAIIMATWQTYSPGPSVTSYTRPVSASSVWQPQVLGSNPNCGGWCAVWHSLGVELDDQGNAVGTWSIGLTGPGNTSTTVATRAAGGAWSPVVLSPDESNLVWNSGQSVAVGPNGTAIFVSSCLYCDGNGGSLVAVRALAPGQMSPRTYLSAVGEQPGGPVAGVDASGRATVAWTSTLGVRVSSRSLAGVWSTPVTLTSTESSALVIAVAPSGAAELAWSGIDGVVRSSRRTGPDAGWSAPVVVSSAPGANSSWSGPTSVAIDSGDKAVLAWTGSDGKIRAAVRPAGASWTTTTIPSAGTNPQVAVNAAGTAFVIFLGPSGAPLAIVRPSGGAWSAPTPIGAAGASVPQIATDAAGNAVAAWVSATGMVQTATFDATGPVLGALSVPASAQAGRSASVAVAPWDLWSPLASVSWDFGDGASVSGPSAIHAYAQPGVYTVTVTATDALGNASATQRSITVTAPPVVTPPRSPTSNPPGTVGTVGTVTVGLPGASAGSSPTSPLSSAAARRLPALRVGATGTGSFRVGSRGVLTLKLSRRVRGALVRVQLRRGLRYTTVARGRVSGNRIPVALTFTAPGRFLVRAQISEANRPTVNRIIRMSVRR